MEKLPSKNDLIASLGVFVIALPLSLGIALASGVSINSAIISAAIGGIVVGALSGAPLAVTGPAAGLTVIVFEIVRTHGVIGLATATIICGLAQLLAGALKIGAIFKKIPHAILDGMLAAIGGVIALGQFFVVIGQPIPNGFLNGLSHLPSVLSHIFLVRGGHDASLAGLIIGLSTIVIQIVWEKLSSRYQIIKLPVPGALVALAIVTLAATRIDVARVTLNLAFDSYSGGLDVFRGQSPGLWTSAFGDGLILALIGSIESLATASGLALYAKQTRDIEIPINLNKELRAQGTGNFISGLMGGIPVTAVIVRSAANIQFGASSRWSTILHGIWILFAAIALAPVLRMIPLPALAAVLIVTGARLMKLKVFIDHLKNNLSAGASYLTTFTGVLCGNLLRGIAIGMLTSAGFWLYQRVTINSRGARKNGYQRELTNA